MTEDRFLAAIQQLFRAAAEAGVVHLLEEHMNDFADGLASGVMMAAFAKALREET